MSALHEARAAAAHDDYAQHRQHLEHLVGAEQRDAAAEEAASEHEGTGLDELLDPAEAPAARVGGDEPDRIPKPEEDFVVRTGAHQISVALTIQTPNATTKPAQIATVPSAFRPIPRR